MSAELFKYKNLDEVLKARGGPVKLLRSSTLGPYVFPGVPPEYTNWRAEQQAWKNGTALLNLSYHIRDLYLTGPDVLRLLSKVGLNKFGDFPKNRGRQIIAASHDGYLIGDGICFHTSDDVYRVVGPPMISDWVIQLLGTPSLPGLARPTSTRRYRCTRPSPRNWSPCDHPRAAMA